MIASELLTRHLVLTGDEGLPHVPPISSRQCSHFGSVVTLMFLYVARS